MNKSKYDIKDLIDVRDNRKTINEVAKKYGVKEQTIKDQMASHKVYFKKTMVKVESPYRQYNKTYDSINECAYGLGISNTSVQRALRGERVKVLEDLEIRIERVEL